LASRIALRARTLAATSIASGDGVREGAAGGCEAEFDDIGGRCTSPSSLRTGAVVAGPAG